MATISVGPDYIASQGQINTNATSKSTFGNVMDAMALTASSTGPVVYESLIAANKPGAASIAGATMNSVYGSAMSAGSTNPYLTTGSLGTSYSGANYYTGTPSTGSMYSTTGTSTDLSSNVESILSETATSQAYLIGIQAQMGQQQSTFTAVSNAINVKYGMEKSAIQNFRV